MMNKIKTLKWLLGIMVIVNIALMSFLFFKKRKGPRNSMRIEKSKDRIRKEFGFDDDQMKRFEDSRIKHKNKDKELTRELLGHSKLYYQDINGGSRDSLMDVILETTGRIYLNNSAHFDEMRSLCSKEQMPAMDRFMKRLITRSGPNGKPNHKRSGRKGKHK